MLNELLPQPLDRLNKSDQNRRALAVGETLFVQDGPTSGLFYLVSGAIDLKRVTRSGHSVTIHRARSGDTFAEASLFSDRYHCTATAVHEVVVIECERMAISQLLESDIEFTRSMASRFASQIQESRRRIELFSIGAADERILTALNDGLLVDDIASFSEMIGLAPETVYRTLRKLSDNGAIQKIGRGVYRLNAE